MQKCVWCRFRCEYISIDHPCMQYTMYSEYIFRKQENQKIIHIHMSNDDYRITNIEHTGVFIPPYRMCVCVSVCTD